MRGPIALPIAIGRLEHLPHNRTLSRYKNSSSKKHIIYMPLVYILYSKMIDHYYIGYTIDSIEVRIEKHLSSFYRNKYTAQVKDWQLYLQIKCETNNQARQI